MEGIDAAEDSNLSLGGTRGWTAFKADPESADFGEVAWDASTTFEDVAHRYGQHPEHRAENKGAGPGL